MFMDFIRLLFDSFNGIIGEVIYLNGEFFLKLDDMLYEHLINCIKEFVAVGNKFENPELLKGVDNYEFKRII